jgi:phosphate acetyltransferase
MQPLNQTSPKLENLNQQISNLAPIEAAVIFPDSKDAFMGAALAAKQNFVRPTFLGNKARINALAAECGENISAYDIVDLDEHEAITYGVNMARQGKVQLIIKGSTHTDELMSAVVNSQTGLRIGKRMTHCMVVDVPQYHKLLNLTDVALNTFPSLPEKKDIVQNAIDLSRSLGVDEPKVALLSTVETINEKIPSTLEYAALCKMAERKQITGGILDGPLSFDLAISQESAQIKKLSSRVAGDADILVFPNIEVGNILFKALDYFANAISMGLILGALVPIIITSRSASAVSRSYSCMLAKFYFYQQQK